MKRIVTASIGDHRFGMRRFHVKTLLKPNSDTFVSGESYSSEPLTPEGTRVLYLVLSIAGIEKVYIKGYELSIIIGEAFDYEDDGITKQIVNILALELGYDEFEFVRRDEAWPCDTFGMDGEVIREQAKYPDNFEQRVCAGHLD